MHTWNPTRRAFVAALAAVPAWAQARLPLLLAQDAPPSIDPAGWLVSEKYDGVRAVWDGHALRFRSGASIAAPGWFTQRLPRVALDGELWLDRGRFEVLSGIVRRQVPDDAGWRQLRYMVFELPGGSGPFADRARQLEAIARQAGWPALVAVPQTRLASEAALQQRLQQVLREGGEGLMLHRADAPYHTGRSPALLKLKAQHDAEAQVIGHVAGRGRHQGRLGALRVRSPEGREFLLGTGLSDAERDAPPPQGSWVSYRYRGLTADGLPRFASFLRVRSEHF
ncbi:MAG: DNA ligase [Burkholderiales bacterium]|nr:DNA ligase [Burkholderiales bacterium]